MTRYGIPDDPATLERVVKLIVDSQNAPVTGSTGAEIQHFVERFNLHNIDCKFEIIRHYVEAVLPRGTVLHRSVRIRNNGDFSWSSKGSQPVLVSYHWLDHQGHVIHFEGHRTPFPVEVAPGREITLPVRIETPKRTGIYRLQLLLVHEYVRWAEEGAVSVPVSISADVPGARAFRTIPADKLPPFTELEDSKRARSMIL
jgi:hypothetical protein